MAGWLTAYDRPGAAQRNAIGAARDELQPIDDDEQSEPDDIDEVPIPGHSFEGKVALRGEVPLDRADQDHGQHRHPERHVKAVEASQHEEG